MNSSATAMLSTPSTPITREYAKATSVYTDPRVRPFSSCWSATIVLGFLAALASRSAAAAHYGVPFAILADHDEESLDGVAILVERHLAGDTQARSICNELLDFIAVAGKIARLERHT